MTKFYLLFLGLISLNLYANDPSKACLSFDFDSNKSTCIEILKKGYVAENAALFCVTLDFASNKLSCLNAAVGKEYTQGAIDLCDSFDFGSAKVNCIESSGTVYEENEQQREAIRLIVLHANKAKRLIFRGDLSMAIESINQIILLSTSL